MWLFLALVLALIPVQQVDTACDNPANPVVAENCQPGTEAWRITSDAFGIVGYVSHLSAAPGETIQIFVNTDAPAFDLEIYRSGYYGGAGGRLVERVEGIAGRMQPECGMAHDTGLISCSRWTASYTTTIPADWLSGVYIGKLIRTDTGGENQVIFVVRDDEPTADVLYQVSDFTWQAYNGYGGKSIYNFNSGECRTISGQQRAVKVSFLRPYQFMIGGEGNPNIYDWVEYPLVFWLEQQGYYVSYSSNYDTHRAGLPGGRNHLLDSRLFISSGHDEYWTQEMRAAITAARDGGTNLAFFSSNVSYWRSRLEPDPVIGQADAVLVSYKSTESGPTDPVASTSTFRDPAGVNNPENALVGIQYMGDNGAIYFPVRVTAEQAQDRIYRHTGLEAMPPGTYINLGDDLVGWEWDRVVDNGQTPAGLVILAESPTYGARLLDAGQYYDISPGIAHITRYTVPGGATVFATGVNQFSWGLAVVEPNPIIQQMVYNVFADMGVEPATPASTLILDGDTTREAPALDPALFLPLDAGGAAPVISNVQIAASEFNATIAWETDKPASGQVWVRVAESSAHLDVFPPPPLIGLDASHEDGLTQHELQVGGLERGAEYTFQVVSADATGRVTITDPQAFQTVTGGFTGQVRVALRPILRSGRCFVTANPTLTAGMVGVAGLVGLLIVWRGAVFILRRRQRAA